MEKRQKKVGSKVLLFWNRSSDEQSAQEETPQEKVPLHKHPHAHKWAVFVSGGVLLVIVIVWLVGSIFLRKVQVGNTQVSANITQQKLQNIVEQQAVAYRLKIADQTGQINSYALDQVGVSIAANDSSNQTLKETQTLKSRLLWWRSQPVTLRTKTDENKLDDFIKQHVRTEITPVKNALLEITPEGKVNISEEQTGQEISVPNPRDSILTAITNLRTQPLAVSEQKVAPAITKSNLNDEQERLKKIIDQPVIFKLGETDVNVNPRDVASWLTLTPDEQNQTYTFSVDQGKVQDTINKVASTNIKKTRNQVVTVAKDGTSTVVVAGINGVDIGNKEDAAKDVSGKLLAADGVKVSLKVTTTPFKTTTIDAGDKLLQVNTTTKRMSAYENNTLIRTFLISAGAAGTPTVTGRYSIYSKYRRQDMRGFNADGSTYFQPNVEWVNYFYRDYAIHGNYWRPLSYFGSVNSSHGCVGVVNSDAEWIYNWAPIGTPVIVTN